MSPSYGPDCYESRWKYQVKCRNARVSPAQGMWEGTVEKMGIEWGLHGWVIGMERHLHERKCTEVVS